MRHVERANACVDADFPSALAELTNAGVRFIVVGGLAATIHGSARLTHDLDIVYSRDPENVERLAKLLARHGAYLRGAPPGLPFVMDAETLRKGLNFTLTTDLGPIDLLGEMLGAGTYEDIVGTARQVSLFDNACLVVDIDTLIRAKRAAGRPKDLEVLAELQALVESQAKTT